MEKMAMGGFVIRDGTRRRRKQENNLLEEERKLLTNPSKIISVFVLFFLFLSSISPVRSVYSDNTSQVFRPRDFMYKKMMKSVRAHLAKINKPAVKTIQSPDGDIIDCVLAHKQPAFDHPKLRGQMPMQAPRRPKGHPSSSRRPANRMSEENFQLWSISSGFCPKGTVPIRRTVEKDVLRATSVQQFGRKLIRTVRRDAESVSNGHQHAVGYVGEDNNNNKYYGAKASINVWAPHVANSNEFSLSQVWVIAGSFGDDLNTIEAGWQAMHHVFLGKFDAAPRGTTVSL